MTWVSSANAFLTAAKSVPASSTISVCKIKATLPWHLCLSLKLAQACNKSEVPLRLMFLELKKATNSYCLPLNILFLKSKNSSYLG